MKKLFAVILLLITNLNSKAQIATDIISAADSLKFTLIETNYGLIRTGGSFQISVPNSPTGKHTISSFYEFTQTTDTIPAELNSNFGVEFYIESKTNQVIPLMVTWKFPTDIVNDKNRPFELLNVPLVQGTNVKFFTSYKFDELYEIKPGIWQLSVMYLGKVLYTRKFFVQLLL